MAENIVMFYARLSRKARGRLRQAPRFEIKAVSTSYEESAQKSKTSKKSSNGSRPQ
jgi:hypothetical protein